MALATITDEHAEMFLQTSHKAYLGIPDKENPADCNRHIYSILLPDDSELGVLAMLEMSRSWPLIAALDATGIGITTPFRDTRWMRFVYSIKGEEIDEQLREMTLPRGAAALSFSFEMLVEQIFLNSETYKPSKVRQTIVVLRDGRTMSLITQPGLGTSRAMALTGGTVDLLKEVMARTNP